MRSFEINLKINHDKNHYLDKQFIKFLKDMNLNNYKNELRNLLAILL